MKIGKYAVIGFALDVFDWVLIGLIPGVGDVADVIATVYWTRVLGVLGLIEAIELIPVADVLPFNTALGMVADGRAATARLAT